MAAVEVPQTLEYRDGSYDLDPTLRSRSCKDENDPGQDPDLDNLAGQKKPEAQWTTNKRKAANLDQRLKSLIMYVLPDDQINSVINCLTAKSTWDNLILYHKGPSDVKESRVIDLKLCYNTFKFKEGESLTQTFTRYKALMNKLVNDGIKLSKLEINTCFINGLPKKWLSFCQSLRNTNHVKDSELASLFGKLKSEENLINSIYETEKNKSLVSTTPLSTAFFSTSIVQDFQDSPDDEEDTRRSHEFLNNLEEEYQSRALLAKSKRFFKKEYLKDFEAKYHNVKAKLALLNLSASTPSSSSGKNKCLITETYDWDDEEVSFDENEVTEVKALMVLTDEERVSVGKESARNGDWTKISMKKVHTLLEIKDNDDRKSFLDYLCIDLNYVEEQRNNLLPKYRNLVQELNTWKEQLFETWLNSSNKFNQCINEQIPTQKKKILGINQLTKDTSSFGSKDPVFIKSSADNSDMSITSSNIPKSSKTEDSTLPNQDNSEMPSNDTRLLSLKKLDGAEHVSGPKTIKSILKSKSTFKAETLKGITINEPSSAPARGKSSSASKTNSAPAGKLKNVKMEDDPPLAIVMKELNELKLQISKKKSSYSRNKNAQQVPPNALQNRYKTQFKMNCDLCGQNNHLSENCYEVLFCKKCKRTNHRTCDHAEFMSSMNANQHHTGQGESSSRSRPSRPSVSFPSCIHCGYNDHHSNDCLYYPTCEICRSYNHDTYGHNMIISLRRGINPRNPQHVTKNCETCGSIVHTISDHNDIKWFRKRETLQAKNVESFKERPDLNSKAICETQLRDICGSLMYLTEKYFMYLSVAKKASLVDKVAMFSADTEDIATVGCCANIL
ncbi:hypothetical protein Tco_1485330 [Tanacetum coccineum]